MTRYFFDVVGSGRSEYDYRGQYLPSPEKAYRLAELIALDLGVETENEWAGSAVAVRTPEGQQLFSVAVQQTCLAIA
jgi:hypothetical protein